MLFFLMFALVVLFLVVCLVRSDCDLTLGFYEKFGKKPGSLRNKVVWITGASSGIGEYLAYELAAAGCKLILSARRTDELNRVRNQCLLCGKLREEDVRVLELDLLDFSSHQDVTKRAINHFGGIDILVNNAGRTARSIFSNTDLAVYREIMDLNYFGPLSLCKSLLPHFLEKKSGQLVFTSSISGKFGVGGLSTYGATKRALHGCFDAVRQEVHSHGVNVTMICPGPVFTNSLRHAFTGTSGQALNVVSKSNEHRMSTSRCALLMATAIANNCDEVWIARHPELLYTYLFQYTPVIARRLSVIFGNRRVELLLAGENNLHK